MLMPPTSRAKHLLYKNIFMNIYMKNVIEQTICYTHISVTTLSDTHSPCRPDIES